MVGAEGFFTSRNGSAKNVEECLAGIGKVETRAGTKRARAWRGVTDSPWALQSSVYLTSTYIDRAPTSEYDDVKCEQELRDTAPRQWRSDNMFALETFAHSKHLLGQSACSMFPLTLN